MTHDSDESEAKEQIAKAVMRALLNALEPLPTAPEVLWHYTSCGTLLKILEGDTLWASHISCLNDASESILLFDMLYERSAQDAELDEQLKECIALQKAKDYAQRSNVFLTSFCVNGDDLNLWRAYAPDGGAAIGFKTGQIIDGIWASVREENAGALPRIHILPVVYKEDKKNKLVSGLVEAIRGFSRRAPKDTDFAVWFRKMWVLWESQLLAIAPLIKHHAFHAEREWRLVAAVDESLSARIRYRERNHALLPYFPIELSNGLPIAEIRVGPHRYQELTWRSIDRLVRSKAYSESVTVSESKIPFRPI